MKAITTGILLFLFIYLLGAFYSVTFNIAEWEPICRSIVATLAGIISIFGAAVVASTTKTKTI